MLVIFYLPLTNLTPSSIFGLQFGSVAQLVEQWTENPRVVGSIPIGTTKSFGLATEAFLFLTFFHD